jgi:hypothetical protein
LDVVRENPDVGAAQILDMLQVKSHLHRRIMMNKFFAMIWPTPTASTDAASLSLAVGLSSHSSLSPNASMLPKVAIPQVSMPNPKVSTPTSSIEAERFLGTLIVSSIKNKH